MGPYASLWVLMGPNGFLCVHMESNGSLWVFMRLYGFLCVVIFCLCVFMGTYVFLFFLKPPYKFLENLMRPSGF